MCQKTRKPLASALALGLAAAGVAALAPSHEALAQADIGAVDVVSRKPKAKKPKVVHAPTPEQHAAPRHVAATPTHHAPATHTAHNIAAASGNARQGATRNANIASASRATGAGAAAAVSGVGPTGLPVAATDAVGSKAPAGSAPALAISQAPLTAIEPTSIVSDKIIRDVISPGADFNELVKYTPGWSSTNANGLIGDTNKGGWRGFSDGQYNVTFDGIPFGDENNPSHHSASYFPAGLVGKAIIDRGPGPASQVGYATFGGTLALQSRELSDNFGVEIENSFGSYSTFINTTSIQTGLVKETGTRALFQYARGETGGAQQYGDIEQNSWLAKVNKNFEMVDVTVFGNYTREHYRNVTNITYPQYWAGGSHYGAVGPNPTTQEYLGNNVSEKQTDMEYINLAWKYAGIEFNNKTYTYSYWYPWYQRNAADQTVEGSTLAGISAKTTLPIPKGDVLGFNQINNYRAWGNIFDTKYTIDAGYASGQLRTGVWWERGDNWRRQYFEDFTVNGDLRYAFYATPAAQLNSYKLDLNSHYQNVQPYIEYEWKPIETLSITPGYKFISFSREHDAYVNQTTLSPLIYDHTYRAGLPFLNVRYRATPDLAVYAQASRGFLVPTITAYYSQNPDLNPSSPQTTLNYQIGAVYKTEDFTADVSLYQITANNFTVANTVNGISTLTAQGNARYRGVELEASYKIVKNLVAYANGTISDARWLEGQFAGLYVPNAPRYSAVGGLVYDDGQFFGSLLQKVTGDQWGNNGQRPATSIFAAGTTNPYLNYIPSYATTDVAIGARGEWFRDLGWNHKVEVKFGVNNLADHRSVTNISGDPTGQTLLFNTKLTYSFQPGRLFYGGFKVNF